jgi:uncharacterized protein
LLPQYCLDCDVRFACHGECPKNRFIETPDGESGLNYLCAGFKDFFHHVSEPMRIMTQALRTERSPALVMKYMSERDAAFEGAVSQAGRNDPCPCGSGEKTKRCHGSRVAESAPTPSMPTQPGDPRPRVRKTSRISSAQIHPSNTPTSKDSPTNPSD